MVWKRWLMLIAVEGAIGSGKKAIALTIAQRFGLPHKSTGFHFRAVTSQVMLKRGNPDHAADALAECDLPLEQLAGSPANHLSGERERRGREA